MDWLTLSAELSLSQVRPHLTSDVVELSLIRPRDPRVKAIVIASDGLWDVMTPQQVGDILAYHTNGIEAARDLVAKASSIWDEKVGHNSEGTSDDVTVSVVFCLEQVGELEIESNDEETKQQTSNESNDIIIQDGKTSSPGTTVYFSPTSQTPGASVHTGQTYSSGWRLQTVTSLV